MEDNIIWNFLNTMHRFNKTPRHIERQDNMAHKQDSRK